MKTLRANQLPPRISTALLRRCSGCLLGAGLLTLLRRAVSTLTTGNHYNGYVSAVTWNLTASRISVEVVAAATSGADTVFAIGIDSNNYYRFIVNGPQLYLQEKFGGVVTQTIIAFDPGNHRFWRIRHDLLTNQVIFETSPNGVTNWNDRRAVPRRIPLTAARIELGAGSLTSVAGPPRSIFDNLVFSSP